MLKEFREFAVKGNVVDMAVGIMIGAAFGTIVRSLVDDVIMPPLGLLTGDLDFTDYFVLLKEGTTPPPYASLAAAKEAGAVVIAYGALISHVISFLLVALVLFFIVRWVNRLRRPDAPPPPTQRPCPYCLMQIDRGAKRCPHCTSEVQPVASGT